jgi:hypothetical protein
MIPKSVLTAQLREIIIMRAKEFVVNVNVPIRIKMPGGDGYPQLAMPGYQQPNININMPDNNQPKQLPANQTNLDKLSGREQPDYSQTKDPQELQQKPVFVPPLQQQIEIQKAMAGKQSPIISDLLQDEGETDEGAFSYDDYEGDNAQNRSNQR